MSTILSKQHAKRFTLFQAGRFLGPCAVRGSFLKIPLDRSSEDGRWHGMHMSFRVIFRFRLMVEQEKLEFSNVYRIAEM